MASITIRNLDDMLKSRLRIQAAVHGRSMEDEARDILWSALNREPTRQKQPGSFHSCQVRAARWRRTTCNPSRTDARAAVLRRMILLDTDILSELMRGAPKGVEAWLADQPDASVFSSAITEAELRYGVALLPSGKRRPARTVKMGGR